MNGSIDILGQQSTLVNLYTQISLCYAVSDASLYPTIIDTLKKGLERLTLHFPWVAGHVEKSHLILSLSSTQKHYPFFIVNDLRDNPSIPTMEAYREARFPMHLFDESIVAPCPTLAAVFGLPPDMNHSPVFLVQVNIIRNGLILTFNGNHQIMDMIGQAQVMTLLSKACHLESSFTEQELLIGNSKRGDNIPLIDDDDDDDDTATTTTTASNLQKKEKNHQINTSSSSTNNNDNPSPSCSWTNFLFQQDALYELKSIASQHLTNSTEFISTDDALSAFIWQSITKARLPRLSSTTTSTFSRAVDVRRFFNLPPTYPGMIQNMTYHTFTTQHIIDSPLGHLASDLRLAVNTKTSTLYQRTRALATKLKVTMDPITKSSAHSVTSTFDSSTDIMLSSWAKVDCTLTMDFNLGIGLPEAVIRPLFTPVESLIYLLPKNKNGDIVVAMCLRDQDMDQLKQDVQFTKYGQFIG